MLISNLEKLSSQRVLTMSNNRKCDYLCVDVGRESTIIMGIKNNSYTTDIILIKEIVNKKFKELVQEVKNICYEFDIHIILLDKQGFSIGFYDEFIESISDNFISIRDVKINSSNYNDIIIKLRDDIEKSEIRLLQTYKCAELSYKKTFLGYSDIMNFHKETDTLIEEFKNLKIDVTSNTRQIRINQINEEISKSRFNCLMLYYCYRYNIENGLDNDSIINNDIKQNKYDEYKKTTHYYNIYGVFYKYMFKAIENKDINIIFYYNENSKLPQFKNIIEEDTFKELFSNKINRLITMKNNIQIIFDNDSEIKFIYANDYARGYRFHYAIVDTDIEREVYDDVVRCKGILFDIAKEKGKLMDNYNIEFLQM